MTEEEKEGYHLFFGETCSYCGKTKNKPLLSLCPEDKVKRRVCADCVIKALDKVLGKKKTDELHEDAPD